MDGWTQVLLGLLMSHIRTISGKRKRTSRTPRGEDCAAALEPVSKLFMLNVVLYWLALYCLHWLALHWLALYWLAYSIWAVNA